MKLGYDQLPEKVDHQFEENQEKKNQMDDLEEDDLQKDIKIDHRQEQQ